MKTTYWKAKKVLVTGGAGFIGSHLVERLCNEGAVVTVLDRMSRENSSHLLHLKNQIKIIKGDCTDMTVAEKATQGQQFVFNLAATVGSIAFNMSHHATMLRDNTLIAMTMLEGARRANVEKYLTVSAGCIYPRDCIIPTPETEGFRGDPEPTNLGYGWAKRYAELFARTYQDQYKMNIGIVRPYNCYGPRDEFNPAVSHVIPSLIRRIIEEENPLVVWGTGTQTRTFLYVDDLVDGLLLALEKYPAADPLNLGSNEEISINDLVALIIKLLGVKRNVVFDISKPDGSPQKACNTQKAYEKIGFLAQTPLYEGIAKTILWYQHYYKKHS